MYKCLAFASPLGCNIKVCTKLIEKLLEHRLAQFRKWTESVCCVQQFDKNLVLISLTSNSESTLLSIRRKTGQNSSSSGENGSEKMAQLLCCAHITSDYPTCSQTPQLISSLILLPIFRRALPPEVKRSDCSKFNTAQTCIVQNWNGTLWT